MMTRIIKTKLTVGETDRTLPARMRTHLGDLPRGAERDEVVATLKGYMAAKQEWSKLDYDVLKEASGLLKGAASPDLPFLDLYSGPPNQDEERVLSRAEWPADEWDLHPEFKESYWVVRTRLRGWLRLASPGAERRAQALAWSGYVVGLEEHGLIPPGHAARLMAELAPWLQPGDPWEAIAREAGLDVAALSPEAAGEGPWRRGVGSPLWSDALPPLEEAIAGVIARSANEDRGSSGNVIVDLSHQEGVSEAAAARGAELAFALDAEAQARGERPHGPLRWLRVIGPGIDAVHERSAAQDA